MGVFSSLIDVGGKVIDNYAIDKRQQLNREWQSQEREAMQEYQTSERESQNAWNLEQWNRENEYNSPLQQVMRLESAGLNPNMIYGGSADIATASSLQGSSGSAPSAPSPAPYALSNTFGDTVSHTIQNLIAEKDLERKSMENGMFVDLTESMINKAKSEAYANFRKGDLDRFQLGFLNMTLDAMVSKSNIDVDIAVATYEQIMATISNLSKDTELKGEQIQTEDARQTNLDSDTRLKNAQAYRQELVNLFRTQFGIDTDSAPVSMLIQGLLSGDERANNTMQKLIDTLKGLFGKGEDSPSWFQNVTGQTNISSRERRRLLKRRSEINDRRSPDGRLPEYLQKELDWIDATLGM